MSVEIITISEQALVYWKLELEEKFKKVYDYYPDSCCSSSSLYLLDKMSGLRLVSGYFDDRSPDGRCHHTWLVAEDGCIVDLTIGQFLPNGLMADVITPTDSRFAYFNERNNLDDDMTDYYADIRNELINRGFIQDDYCENNEEENKEQK